MSRAIVILLLLLVVAACLDFRTSHRAPAPADPDKLSCVRVKEVAPGGKINYLCETRK